MSPSPARAPRRQPRAVEFLEDWRDDHRPLAEAHRADAGRYIGAILRHDEDTAVDPVLAEVLAIQLWVRFRDLYDDLRGPLARSNGEDFFRAMSRL